MAQTGTTVVSAPLDDGAEIPSSEAPSCLSSSLSPSSSPKSFVITGELFDFDGKQRSLGSRIVRKVFFTSTSERSRLAFWAGSAVPHDCDRLRSSGLTSGHTASSSQLFAPGRSGNVRAFGIEPRSGSFSIVRKVFLTARASELTPPSNALSIGQVFIFRHGLVATPLGLGSSATSSAHATARLGWVLALGGRRGDSSSSLSTVRNVFFTLTLMSTSSAMGESRSAAMGRPAAGSSLTGMVCCSACGSMDKPRNASSSCKFHTITSDSGEGGPLRSCSRLCA
mmetsp:Transcript_82567/g.246210  ORF Transcript_82567/g.246210 Transcript_82567/m.246210 type:complete len:282 (-) Transcript_82567:21-866(-)